MIGGGGTNKVDYVDRSAPLVISTDGLANDGEFSGGERDNVGSDIQYIFCGRGADVVNASKGRFAYVIAGNAGNDTITGSAGSDYIVGNGGNDLLSGGPGNDT